MHRAVCNLKADVPPHKERKATSMELEFLKDFSEKWQLNKKTVKILESNNIIDDDDFLDLSESDIENLALTIGQKNSLKRGIAVLKLSRTLTSDSQDDLRQLSSSASFYSLAEQSECPLEDMGFVKRCVYQGLRYVFLLLLIGYHFLRRLGQSLLSPLQPIRDEAKKVPKEETTLTGLVAALKKAFFLAFMFVITIAESVIDKFLQPMQNIVECMSDFVEKYTPASNSRHNTSKMNVY